RITSIEILYRRGVGKIDVGEDRPKAAECRGDGTVRPREGERPVRDVAAYRSEKSERAEGHKGVSVGWVDVRKTTLQSVAGYDIHCTAGNGCLRQASPRGCKRRPPGVLKNSEWRDRESAVGGRPAVPIDLAATAG